MGAVVERGTPAGLPKVFIEIAAKVYRLDRSHIGGYYSSLEEARQAIASARAQV